MSIRPQLSSKTYCMYRSYISMLCFVYTVKLCKYNQWVCEHIYYCRLLDELMGQQIWILINTCANKI